MDRESKSSKTGAKTSVSHSPRKRAPAGERSVELRLEDALAQQAATAEILRVMADSSNDVQPVLHAIAEQAARLCRAAFARVFLVDGDMIRPLAQFTDAAELETPVHVMPLSRGSITGRATLDRKVVHVADIVPLLDHEFPDARENLESTGFRAALAVPLLRHDACRGAIFLWRREPGLFAPDQVALVETFARQAAIAIDNARLFNEVQARNRELAESLEQQTATSEILRVISRSQTDVQPVFDTIVAATMNLCRASMANVYTFDGEQIHLVALVNANPAYYAAIHGVFPRPPGRDTAVGRAIDQRAVVSIPDVLDDPEYEIGPQTLVGGFRSVLAVPLMREQNPIGVIIVGAPEPGPFPDAQVALLQTFADQAVIAIENARLFNEVQARNRDLTEALEQQTATSEILRVISASPTDVQPVFDTIAANALRLCDGIFSGLYRFDGEFIHIGAMANIDSVGVAAFATAYPCRPSRGGTTQRAILTREIVHMPDILTEPEYVYHDVARTTGYRSVLSVPMLRNGYPLGTLTVYRDEPRPFPEAQIALLRTFADQAVIAIENVRLFSELGARNRELTEALEQQTASNDVLRVIGRTQTEVQPVFDTIASAALKLCGATSANVVTFDGELVHVAALARGDSAAGIAIDNHFASYPRPPSHDTANTRAILTRRVVAIRDVLEDPDYAAGDTAVAAGYRSVLAVPLMRGEQAIGAITVARPNPGPLPDSQVALLQTFADQAVIAIENVRLFTELQARNRDVTAALEQQTATSDILRAISQSPTDEQPVFDAIAAAVLKLCRADFANVFTYDGELIHFAATVNVHTDYVEMARKFYPRPAGRDTAATRAIATGTVCMIPDVLADPEYVIARASAVGGFRSVFAVPLLREGRVLGAIAVGRPEPGLFADALVALVETFADQAVIAIENVRLFNELQARNRDVTVALEQQTATSDILRAISQSPTDTQPVFDTIAEAAMVLCSAKGANVFTFDGTLVHLASHVHVDPAYSEALLTYYPRVLGRETAVMRAIHARHPVAIPDVQVDQEYVPAIGQHAVAGGFRSILAVPLMREGSAVGGIAVGRSEPGSFPETQIALLQTFADQAVIAIENVRLFTELQARNRDLTEALEQQTATSEILRVISGSRNDVQPVFETIVHSVRSLCDATFSGVYLLDGEMLSLAAAEGMTADQLAAFKRGYPRKIGPDTVSGRAALECRVVQAHDLMTEPDYRGAPGTFVGARTVLGVPLKRNGRAIGAIGVWRGEVRPFSEVQIALLQTFADQAVIAIENVRLFRELEARTAALTRSVAELKALGEIGQTVSSTLDLETVLHTIVARATELTGMDGGSIYEYDEVHEQFHLHSANGLPHEVVEALRATPVRRGEGALGRMAITGQPVQFPDVADESMYQSHVRDLLVRNGYRSLLAVPLLRENHLLGGLSVNRKIVGTFDPNVIELLKTFATQSAIAIQNARLFREIEIKSRELETASRHKSEFLANMSHELRTPLNAIIGFSEVLSERLFGDMNAKQAEYVEDISASGRHLLELINDILDLSKIEAGRMELDPSDVDLAKVIGQTLALVRERAERRVIALDSEVDPRIGVVRVDERKVKQVLLNLLSNALKFTPEGGSVHVAAKACDDRVEVSVRDTGVGIAPQDQEAVFEEFRQVGAGAARTEGTGLGLAISRKFIELHGGRFWLASELGKGSTFTFSLPRQ